MFDNVFGQIDRYFWSCYSNEAPSVELKQPQCFLLFFFFFVEKSIHLEMVWNFVLSLSLPTFHYSIIAFWQRILRSVVVLWKLSLLDCPLLTLPVSTKLGPIDDFANFSSKFWTHFYLYNGFVTFSNTQHKPWHKLVLTYCITSNVCLVSHHNPDVIEIFYGRVQ